MVTPMESEKQAPPHIMVVDDDDIIREAMHQNLTSAGFRVSEAENGVRAVQTIERLRPDILLLDVMMPEMDGFTTARAIRKMAEFQNTPILIMTSLDDLASINKAFEVGATDFITKPINWVILVERLRFMMRAVQMARHQQRMKQELIHAQKMEALGTLAGGVAHDLNNVLAAIVGYPDLLLCKLENDSPLRKPILAIRSAGEKAADIVQDLLTMARRGVSVKKIIRINEMIGEYLSSPEYSRLMSYHQNVQVETRLDDRLLNVAGSPIHIRKTIMNLVSNAAEAQPEGGTIRIETRNHTFQPDPKKGEQSRQGEFVAVEISDKGCGLTQEEISRIFEPFYTKKVMGRSGTGLGMSVVWGTVQDHRGYVDIRSLPNKGTTFSLYFPATSEAKEEEKIIPVNEYMGDGQTILVVDDLAEQREIAVGLLKMLGYAPVAVSSGEAAIDYLKSKSAELVLLDMIMDGGMDGLETYQKILETHPNQKALVTSGYTETERVRQVQQMGAGDFVKKPYSMETIGLAIMVELNEP